MYKLEVQDLHKRYGSHEVLKGVSLAAKAGDVMEKPNRHISIKINPQMHSPFFILESPFFQMMQSLMTRSAIQLERSFIGQISALISIFSS